MIIQNISKFKFINSLLKFSLSMFILFMIISILSYFFEIDIIDLKINIFLFFFFLFTFLFLLLKNYNYFYFNNEESKIIIRFYSLSKNIFKKQRNVYEIPKNAFLKYKILKKGIKQEIIFFQKTSKGHFEYPAINISILNKKNIENLEKALKK